MTDIFSLDYWHLVLMFIKPTINHFKFSGLFKGYGFACFTSKVAALQARHVLDGQEVDGHLVDCGWLKEGTHHLSDLHSKVCDNIKLNETHFTFSFRN